MANRINSMTHDINLMKVFCVQLHIKVQKYEIMMQKLSTINFQVCYSIKENSVFQIKQLRECMHLTNSRTFSNDNLNDKLYFLQILIFILLNNFTFLF